MDLVWWSIWLCWLFLVFAMRGQQEFVTTFHPNHHDDRGKLLKIATVASIVIALIAVFGLLYLHYMAFGVLWSAVLGLTAGLLAAVLWGILSAILGDRVLALAGFVVWPVSAVSAFLLLRLSGS